MKRLLLLLPLGALLLGALAAAAWLDNSANRGVTYIPPSTPLPYADGPQVGVNLLNLHAEPDPAVVARSLTMVRDMGARYVRMQLPWEDIEIAAKGDFVDRRNDLNGDGALDAVDAWRKYDRIVDTAASLGLSLTLRLERPPQWARLRAIATLEWQEGVARDGNSTGPPDTLSDYGDFVGRVAARYRGKVRFYQIWNEPNLKNEWNWQEPRPEAFVELLRVGAGAVRAADPAAVVIFPSLSPVDGLDKRAPMTELEYLDRVYVAGGGAYFDVMSAQAYGLGQPPDEHRYVRLRSRDNWTWRRPLDTRADVSRIVLLREVMER
ncbi:MAG: cellulase family glycosylhydrolase, partial [Chloroflexales bacterium]|nr:cellulase family glycosylhydrolase [Chloroflexales bacterium]